MELLGVDIIKILTRDLIHLLFIWLLGGFLLHIAAGYLSFERRMYRKAIAVMITGGVTFFILEFVPFVGGIFGHLAFWYFIKHYYNVGWDRAAAAWAMSIMVAFIISLVVLAFFGIDIFFSPQL